MNLVSIGDHMTHTRLVSMLATGLALVGSAAPARAQAAQNALTPAEQAAGWRLLFDGRTTKGWRGYRMDSLPRGWPVVNGPPTRIAHPGHIVIKDKFANFELTLEWNISAGRHRRRLYRP